MRLRFECFQHVPEDAKYRIARRMICLPFEDPAIGAALLPAFAMNRFQDLERMVSAMKRQPDCLDMRNYPRVDTDLLLSLFWRETDPPIAARLLSALFGFNLATDDPNYRRVWNVATNLLGCAQTQADKEAIFILLETYRFNPMFAEPLTF